MNYSFTFCNRFSWFCVLSVGTELNIFYCSNNIFLLNNYFNGISKLTFLELVDFWQLMSGIRMKLEESNEANFGSSKDLNFELFFSIWVNKWCVYVIWFSKLNQRNKCQRNYLHMRQNVYLMDYSLMVYLNRIKDNIWGNLERDLAHVWVVW